MSGVVSRRRFLQLAGGSVASTMLSDSIARALAIPANRATRSIKDVEHIVVLMQENRSFDHYFGTLSGVRGFSDAAVPTQTVGGVTRPVFDQYGFQPGSGPSASGYIQPFHLLSDPPLEDGQTTNDISHSWATQHNSWNNGKMDAFITAHLAADGATNGPVTMGYYTRQDLGT
jgi:phospholipase C